MYIESLIVILVIERLLTALLTGVVHQKVAIIGLDYMLILKVNNNNFNLKINFINLSKI